MFIMVAKTFIYFSTKLEQGDIMATEEQWETEKDEAEIFCQRCNTKADFTEYDISWE
jgi:hypothetical protein